MNKTIILSDKDFNKISTSNIRMVGSVAMIDDNTLEFRAWNRKPRKPRKKRKVFLMPHSRATISEDDIRFTLCIDRKELEKQKKNAAKDAPEIIYEESDDAAAFVEDNIDLSPRSPLQGEGL